MKNEFQCPEHNVPLKKKYIFYGLPSPNINYDDVILGGCFLDPDSPKCGYVCPEDQAVFYMKDGKLEKNV